MPPGRAGNVPNNSAFYVPSTGGVKNTIPCVVTRAVDRGQILNYELYYPGPGPLN